MLLECIVALTLLFMVYVVYDRILRFPGEYPGPFRWPIVGNINLFINDKFRDQIEAVQQSMDTPLMTLMIGSRKILVCNNPEYQRSIYRVLSPGKFEDLFDDHDVINNKIQEGKTWRSTRKMIHTNLLSKNSILDPFSILAKHILIAINDIREKTRDCDSFDSSFSTSKAILNTFSELVYGGTIDEGSLKLLGKKVYEMIRFDVSWRRFSMIVPIKWLNSLLFQSVLISYRTFIQNVQPAIQSAMSSFIPNSTRKTFIEILLQKQHVASEKGTIPEYLANTSIKQVAWISIYQGHAGIHIHFNAILTNLALNPEWQDRIYREIQEAEPNIKPTPKIHNPDFPILCAFIKESLRDIPGFLIGRRVLKDFNIEPKYSKRNEGSHLLYKNEKRSRSRPDKRTSLELRANIDVFDQAIDCHTRS
eukprot:980104_1